MLAGGKIFTLFSHEKKKIYIYYCLTECKSFAIVTSDQRWCNHCLVIPFIVPSINKYRLSYVLKYSLKSFPSFSSIRSTISFDRYDTPDCFDRADWKEWSSSRSHDAMIDKIYPLDLTDISQVIISDKLNQI